MSINVIKDNKFKIPSLFGPKWNLMANVYGKEIQKRSFDEVDIKRDHSMTTKTCHWENEQLLSQFTMLLMATLQGRAFHSLYLVDVHGGGGGGNRLSVASGISNQAVSVISDNCPIRLW